MTYHELVEKVNAALTAVDASSVSEHVAVQVNVTGEAAGAFYIEVAEGKVAVEPWEYYDRDALVTASEEDILAVAAGKLNLESAIAEGKIAFEGDYSKAMLLNGIFAQLPVAKAKKTAAKKTTTKKTAAPKKTAAKKTAVKEEKEEAAPAKRKTTRTKKAAETAEAAAAEATPAAKKTRTTKKAAKAE